MHRQWLVRSAAATDGCPMPASTPEAVLPITQGEQMRSPALDPTLEEQQLVEAALQRRRIPLRARERQAEALLGGGFVLACVLLILAAPPWHARVDPAAALCCALALAVAVRVHFAVGPGYTVPTQLAFIPLAFAVPPGLL